MTPPYASPADWDCAAEVIKRWAEANGTCAAEGGPLATNHVADAAAMRRVLASIAAMGLSRPAPAPSRFATRHGDLARLVVGAQ